MNRTVKNTNINDSSVHQNNLCNLRSCHALLILLQYNEKQKWQPLLIYILRKDTPHYICIVLILIKIIIIIIDDLAQKWMLLLLIACIVCMLCLCECVCVCVPGRLYVWSNWPRPLSINNIIKHNKEWRTTSTSMHHTIFSRSSYS